MYKLRLSIILLIFSIVGAFAQNSPDAERVINDLLASVKVKAVTTNFELSVTEKNGVPSQPVSGTFVMKANKFTIDMGDSKAWFDGKTQWTYLKADNEVSITEPSTDELAQVNPMAILASFKAKSLVKFGKANQTTSMLVELIPKSKKDDYLKAEVQINKQSKVPQFIRLTDKKRTVTMLKLTNYKVLGTVNDAIFVFNKANYKQIQINDLR